MSVASDVGWTFFAFGLALLLFRVILLVRARRWLYWSDVPNFPVVLWFFVFSGMGMAILITSAVILDNPCPKNCKRIDLHDSNIVANYVFGGIFIALAVIFCFSCDPEQTYHTINYNIIILASWDYLFLFPGICLVAVDHSLGSCPASCP